MREAHGRLDLALAAHALNGVPGVLQVYRIDIAKGTSEWVFLHRDCEKVFGLPYDTVYDGGPTVLGELVHPDDVERMNAEFLKGVQTLEPTHYTIRMRRPDGRVNHFEVTSTYQREDSGAILVVSHTRDIAERIEMQARLDQGRRDLETREALYRTVIEALPVGVGVMRLDGSFPITNEALRRMVPLTDAERSDLRYREHEQYLTVRRADGTIFPAAEQPLGRVMAGAEQAEAEMVVEVAGRATRRLASSAFALKGEDGKLEQVLSVSLDVTAQRALEDELQQRNAQLAESEAEKTQLIERLRHALDELSNPILEVWEDVLLLPVIGLVDSRRAADMVARLLDAVAEGRARHVIIDLTGVEIVDTRTADHLIKLVKKVELVGARCVLTGIRPAVAQTLVDIGVDFGRLTTLRNLKHGLRDALVSARRDRRQLADDIIDEELESQEAREGSRKLGRSRG
ncbi:MAG: STAS domain-containing protein [Sandaracinus sp.]